MGCRYRPLTDSLAKRRARCSSELRIFIQPGPPSLLSSFNMPSCGCRSSTLSADQSVTLLSRYIFASPTTPYRHCLPQSICLLFCMSDMLGEMLSSQVSAPESLTVRGGRLDKGFCQIFWVLSSFFHRHTISRFHLCQMLFLNKRC